VKTAETGTPSEVSFENRLALAVAKEMSKWLQAQDTRTAKIIGDAIKPLYEMMAQIVKPMMNETMMPQVTGMPPAPPAGPQRNSAELVVLRDGDGYSVNVLYSDMNMKELHVALSLWLGGN